MSLTVALSIALSGRGGSIPVPGGVWGIKSSDGTSYSVTQTVLNSSGTAYVAIPPVLSSDGTPYNPV